MTEGQEGLNLFWSTSIHLLYLCISIQNNVSLLACMDPRHQVVQLTRPVGPYIGGKPFKQNKKMQSINK